MLMEGHRKWETEGSYESQSIIDPCVGRTPRKDRLIHKHNDDDPHIQIATPRVIRLTPIQDGCKKHTARNNREFIVTEECREQRRDQRKPRNLPEEPIVFRWYHLVRIL